MPREIIQKIFYELLPSNLHQDPPHTLHLRRRGTRPNWLVVTHVCREWRSASLEWKSFWTYIPLESLGWTQQALTLSKDQSIFIDSGVSVSPATTDPAALSLALTSAFRAKQISVATREATALVQSLEILRASEAPRLERLEIMLLMPGAEPRPTIPIDIFQGNTPEKLRILVVMDVFCPMDAKIYSASLTHLEMAFGRPAWENLGSFFDTVASLPNLEYLALMRGAVLPSWQSGDPHVTGAPRKIKLPRCRTLRLNGDSCVILRCLETLEAPNNEVGCLVFGYEHNIEGQPAHAHWDGLLSISSAIQSVFCMDTDKPSASMRHLVMTTGMQPLWQTLGEMTAFLQTVPDLTTFIARCSPWFELPGPDDGVEPVRMDAIERLHLWSRFPGLLSTLSQHIEVPQTAERLVTVDGGPPEGMSIPDFAASLREAFGLFDWEPGAGGPSYTQVTVSELQDRFFLGVCVTVSHPTAPGLGEMALPPRMELNIPLFTLGVPAVHPPRETVERLADLTEAVMVNVFPLHSCHTVRVSSLLFEEDSNWTRAFSHLKTVEQVHAGPGVKMASTAAYMLWQTRLPPRTEPLFPVIQMLHVACVDFRDPLAPFLQSTRCPLSRSRPEYALEIERSFIDEDILHQLSRPFDRLHWDGISDKSAVHVDRRWRREPVHAITLTPATAVAV